MEVVSNQCGHNAEVTSCWVGRWMGGGGVKPVWTQWRGNQLLDRWVRWVEVVSNQCGHNAEVTSCWVGRWMGGGGVKPVWTQWRGNQLLDRWVRWVEVVSNQCGHCAEVTNCWTGGWGVGREGRRSNQRGHYGEVTVVVGEVRPAWTMEFVEGGSLYIYI